MNKITKKIKNFFFREYAYSECFCPNCRHEILQDRLSQIYEGGTFTNIVCSKCNIQSKWCLDTPTPVLLSFIGKDCPCERTAAGGHQPDCNFLCNACINNDAGIHTCKKYRSEMSIEMDKQDGHADMYNRIFSPSFGFYIDTDWKETREKMVRDFTSVEYIVRPKSELRKRLDLLLFQRDENLKKKIEKELDYQKLNCGHNCNLCIEGETCGCEHCEGRRMLIKRLEYIFCIRED